MARRRSAATELVRLLSATDRPVYVLDPQRRIVFCNPACTQWLGIEQDELLGRRCDYHAGSADVAAAIAPPPPPNNATAWDAEIIFQVADGAVTRRRVQFSSFGGPTWDAVGVLAIVGVDELPLAAPTGEAPELTTAEQLHSRLQHFYQSLRARYRLRSLAGESPAIHRVREQARLAIESRVHLSIVGREGSGREYLARTIHAAAAAPTAPLLPLDCELLDADLLRTTVMAFVQRCNDVEAADQAALLLLEVERLPLDAQLELWSFLQLPTFQPRAIVTSRRGLLELAEGGGFHRDLALALSVLEIRLPPLSTRRQDIPFLAQQFVEDFNAEGGKQLAGFTVEALDRLCALPWNGDVGELAEIVQGACAQAEGPRIGITDLPRRVALLVSAAEHPRPLEPERIKLDDFLAEVERELLERALRNAKGNKAEAARLLGINRTRLLRRIEQLGLDGP